jgi:hypothetical protein
MLRARRDNLTKQQKEKRGNKDTSTRLHSTEEMPLTMKPQ